MHENPARRPARPVSVSEGLSTPGESLDARTRDRLQEGFGRDLGEVRVHTGEEAARSAHRVGARAYTVGPDIVFGPGRYRPDDAEGWRLLSHEIAHVVQQRAAPAAGAAPPPAGESRERAARGAADAVVRGEPVPELAASEGRELARDRLTVDDFDEPDPATGTSPAPDDEDAGLLAAQATPFAAQVSAVDPSVIFVPIDAGRETIARELGVDMSEFYVVGAAEAPPSDQDHQGIRFYRPADIPAGLATRIRDRLEAKLPADVQATVDALVTESDEWTAPQYALRWMQYSTFLDAAGRSYLDRYLDALDRRTITTTRDWLVTTTSSDRSALAELLAQTSGDVHAAVLRVRARSGRAVAGDAKPHTAGPLPLGEVIGRWVSGRDTSAVPAQVATVLMAGVADREAAEIRIRNANFLGPKAMILGSEGLWYGYGLFFDTSLVGTWPPPIVGGDEENGRFYWYHPSTVFVGHGETDPNGWADQPRNRLLQARFRTVALADPDLRAVLSLDYGTLRGATTEQRLEIFRRIVDAGFEDTRTRGYSVSDTVQTMTRVVLGMPPGDFAAFERGLDAAGITAKLIATKDARFAPLGAAFTFQTMAGTDLAPGSFTEPIELRQGTTEIAAGLDYYLAQADRPAGPAGTAITFEHGYSTTGWGDTPAWSSRTKWHTRPLRPTDLVSVETITPTGTHRRIASAFEAALTQGDPESQVEHETFMDFLSVIMIVQGGLGAMRLGSIGARAAAAGSLRAAIRVLAEELATQAGKQAVRSVVDLALFTAARYAADHQEELEKTAEGRAFLAVVTAATALLAARDVGALVESGAIERLILTGHRALTVVSESARAAVGRAMLNFRAARLAWDALKREGLLVETNVGGLLMRRPASPAKFVTLYRVGQAQAAGEQLMATLGSSATAERASATLARLEKAAGQFVRRGGGPAHTEAELEAAKAYRDVAQRLSGLANKQRVAVLDALDQLMAGARRPVAELAPFIQAAMKGGPARAVAYLEDVTWLSRSGISGPAFARLGEKALGPRAVDLSWLRGLKLSPKDLDDLAINPDTAWTSYRKVSLDPTDKDLLKKAWRDLRGHASEVVAGEEAAAGRLARGYRVSGKHVVTPGGSEIDLELTSTDRLGRKRLAEVKGWQPKLWKRSLDAYHQELNKIPLTDEIDIRGAKMVKKMLKQLADARAVTEKGVLPLLAVTEKLPAGERVALEALVAGKAEVVYLPEAAIAKVSGRLARALGMR